MPVPGPKPRSVLLFGPFLYEAASGPFFERVLAQNRIGKGDAAALRTQTLPVFAAGVTHRGPYKNGPGEINVPVVIGGKLVRPGDIVVGDDDGVLFIDPAIAAELADATEAVEKKEADIMAHILGDGTYIRPWVDEKLKEISCEIL